MAQVKNSVRQIRGNIVYLPVDEISPNPVQPRKHFNKESLEELRDSISEHGIVNPLTVRLRCGRYELVAGERRLRAAKLAGLTDVPCIVVDVNIEESHLIALVENLQRRDLDYIEEAEGISQLIRLFGMSQEEAARRLGKSQSAVANKLRLLKLPSDILERLRENELSERHGRALLRLPTAESQRSALEYILKHDLTVAATDTFIDTLLAQQQTALKTGQRRTLFIMKDVSLFLNTLTRSMDLMKQGGINVRMEKRESDCELLLTISIPKGKR
jgi:ParB family chromosome partitioning protein